MTLCHNRIENNYALAKGGGVALFNGSGSELSNNLIAGNSTDISGGIYIESSPGCAIANCSIAGNVAILIVGGIATYQFSYPVIRNCIVYGNTAPLHLSLMSAFDDSFDVSYSDIEGGWEGIEILNDPPLFASGLGGDYYLSQIESGQFAQSPVVDRGGDSSAVMYLDTMTTRTDQIGDHGIVDQGFHYYRNPSSGRIEPSNHPRLPSSFAVVVYPNPLNGSATIDLTLPVTSPLTMVVYDILGRKVLATDLGIRPAGNQLITWSGTGSHGDPLATGSYFLILTTPYQSQAKKLIILK